MRSRQMGGWMRIRLSNRREALHKPTLANTPSHNPANKPSRLPAIALAISEILLGLVGHLSLADYIPLPDLDLDSISRQYQPWPPSAYS